METIAQRTRFEAGELRAFVARALEAVGVGADDARVVGEVLVTSDIRGIESHGVARLEGFYVDRIRDGIIDPRAVESTLHESDTLLAVDANNGLGHPVSVRAMTRTIEKARANGCAIATVRYSNHFGIAGYYAMMALPHDCIGIASTNAGRIVVATGGRDPKLGTNPFAYAIPAENGDAFVLDMATATVALGKLEIAKRVGKTLNPGWAIDSDGRPTTDPDAGMLGALLPLGGFGTEGGGHKGYGLALLCDILCGVLAGGMFAPQMPSRREMLNAKLCSHFFAAVRIDGFRDPADFKRDLSALLHEFRTSAPAPGYERVYTAGEIEAEKTRAYSADGIPLDAVIVASLDRTAEKLGIAPAARR